MGQPFFRFKEFTVYHDRCAMKVGTDGVLLGAWTCPCFAERILDIGTGSGLIALMLAQKSSAIIDAIEVDKEAADQAADNFSQSPWPDRLHLFQRDFLSFAKEFPPSYSYDLIVSNPPYFQSSLESADSQRTIARHSSSLSLQDIVTYSAALLSPKGRLNLILPIDYLTDIEPILQTAGLYLCDLLYVSDREGKKEKRILLSATFFQQTILPETLFLKDNNNKRSAQLQILTRDYYL